MAAKDFSAGEPRPGQFVFVEVDGKRHIGLAVEPNYGQWEEEVEENEPAGVDDVGKPLFKRVVKKIVRVHHKTHPLHPDTAILEGRLDQIIVPPSARPTGKWLVDMVDKAAGFQSLGHALVPVERLTPVLKFEDLPADFRRDIERNNPTFRLRA